MFNVICFKSYKDAPKIADIERRMAHDPAVPVVDWLFSLSEIADKWDMFKIEVLWQFEFRGIGDAVIEADGFISLDGRAILLNADGQGPQLGLGILQHHMRVAQTEGRQAVDIDLWLKANPRLDAVARGESQSCSMRQVVRQFMTACGYNDCEIDERKEPYSPELKARVDRHLHAEHIRKHGSATDR